MQVAAQHFNPLKLRELLASDEIILEGSMIHSLEEPFKEKLKFNVLLFLKLLQKPDNK